MSVGIPKSLTSYGEILKGAESLKQITTENIRLLPNNQNATAVYSPDTTNSIYFRIPNYSNSFLSTKESFLQFDFLRSKTGSAPTTNTLNIKLADWAGVFNRIVIKSSNGLVLQDTNNAHILSKLFYLVSVNDHAKINEADYSDVTLPEAKGIIGTLQASYKTYTMKFNHGILNLDQALPLHLMGSSYALDIELYLSKPEECLEVIGAPASLGNISYSLTNVSYNMKLLRLDETLIRKYNMIMSSNNEIVLPYTVMKNYVSSQTAISQSHFFHESCSDIRKMFTVITAPTETFGDDKKPIVFKGCVKESNLPDKIVEYNVKVSTHQIFNEPIREDSSNAVTLKHLKNCVNVKENNVMKVERYDKNSTATALYTNFENKENFIIGASFIYSNDDRISQGISLNGNPVQLSLTFAAQPSVRVQTFMELGYNMHISQGQVTFHEVDPNRQSY